MAKKKKKVAKKVFSDKEVESLVASLSEKDKEWVQGLAKERVSARPDKKVTWISQVEFSNSVYIGVKKKAQNRIDKKKPVFTQLRMWLDDGFLFIDDPEDLQREYVRVPLSNIRWMVDE